MIELTDIEVKEIVDTNLHNSLNLFDTTLVTEVAEAGVFYIQENDILEELLQKLTNANIYLIENDTEPHDILKIFVENGKYVHSFFYVQKIFVVRTLN